MNAAYKTGHQMGNLPKPVIAAMLSVIPLTGIGLGALAVYTGYVGIADGYPAVFSLYAAGMVLCVAVFVFALGWCLAASGMARFRFEAEGLVVKYPLEKEKRIPWHQFQQVCVCYAAYTTRGQKKANISSVLGDWAGGFFAVSMLLFGAATVLCWAHYGMTCVRYLTEGCRREGLCTGIYTVLLAASLTVGAVASPGFAWSLADAAIALMTLVNLLALLLLRKEVAEETDALLLSHPYGGCRICCKGNHPRKE